MPKIKKTPPRRLLALLSGFAMLATTAVFAVSATPAQAATTANCTTTSKVRVTLSATDSFGGYALLPTVGNNGTTNCIMGVGNNSSGVKTVQHMSVSYYWQVFRITNTNIDPDGKYGTLTKAAVTSIQRFEYASPYDGIYGPVTKSRMCFDDADGWGVWCGSYAK